MNLSPQDLHAIRCAIHDFDALKDALKGSLQTVKAIQERGATLTYWRDSGMWPQWLLEERGCGQVGMGAQSEGPITRPKPKAKKRKRK